MVEGESNIFQRNNLGLPGTEVVVSESSRYVFVLGCSYVEAMQVPPDSMATSVFQRRLSRIDPRFQVLNLGHSGHDLYDSFRRSAFFEQTFPPEAVILEIHDDGASLLPRHAHPLTFTLPPDFGKPNLSLTTAVSIFLRDQSSLANIIANAIKNYQLGREEEERISRDRRSRENRGGEVSVPTDLFTCLGEFHRKYKEKFCVVSILQDAKENEALGDYCRKHGLKFLSKQVIIPENRISGSGHLNVSGNTALGDLLYGSFIEVHGKP
jgi:hypothetical protein